MKSKDSRLVSFNVISIIYLDKYHDINLDQLILELERRMQKGDYANFDYAGAECLRLYVGNIILAVTG